MAVEQRAPPRRKHDPLGAPGTRLLRPAPALEQLHLGRPAQEQEQPEKHGDFDDPEADRGLRHGSLV